MFVLQFLEFIRISCVENSPVCLSLLSFFRVFIASLELELGWDGIVQYQRFFTTEIFAYVPML